MFRWLADGGGCGEVVVAAAEGVADGCRGRRRKRGRRASPGASGRQPFCGTATSSGSLLFPPSPSPPPPSHSPSRSPSGLGTSLHALIVSVLLVLPIPPPLEVVRVVLLFLIPRLFTFHVLYLSPHPNALSRCSIPGILLCPRIFKKSIFDDRSHRS